MKIIIGLGNPGTKYEQTRHNVGWVVLDLLVKDFGLEISDFRLEKKFNAEVLEVPTTPSPDCDTPPQGGGEAPHHTLFVKPQTFMNDSGIAVKSIVNFYKLDPAQDILVIHDDSDLPFGTIRTTASSSSAGQNGVQDIIDKLGTQDFQRIRIGVDTRASRKDMDTREFVLGNFTEQEIKKLQDKIFPEIKTQIENFIN